MRGRWFHGVSDVESFECGPSADLQNPPQVLSSRFRTPIPTDLNVPFEPKRRPRPNQSRPPVPAHRPPARQVVVRHAVEEDHPDEVDQTTDEGGDRSGLVEERFFCWIQCFPTSAMHWMAALMNTKIPVHMMLLWTVGETLESQGSNHSGSNRCELLICVRHPRISTLGSILDHRLVDVKATH